MKKIILVVLVILLITLILGFACKSDEAQTNYETTEIDVTNPATEDDYTPKYTEEELSLLAKIIWAEAGSDHLTDEHQRAVASVVINRKNDDRFPNTIKGVIYQKGQYRCVSNGMINQAPNQRAYDNAKFVLENGITIPEGVVWQARFKQGKGLYKYIQGHYFCY